MGGREHRRLAGISFLSDRFELPLEREAENLEPKDCKSNTKEDAEPNYSLRKHHRPEDQKEHRENGVQKESGIQTDPPGGTSQQRIMLEGETPAEHAAPCKHGVEAR